MLVKRIAVEEQLTPFPCDVASISEDSSPINELVRRELEENWPVNAFNPCLYKTGLHSGLPRLGAVDSNCVRDGNAFCGSSNGVFCKITGTGWCWCTKNACL